MWPPEQESLPLSLSQVAPRLHILSCCWSSVRGRHKATATSKHTSRTVTGSPAKSYFPSSLFQNCMSKQSIIYLLPDRVVAKKAPDFTPGERPGGVGISVSRQHFNIQGLQLACVECPARQRTCLKINKLRCPHHRSQKESSTDSQSLYAHGEKCHRFPVIP